MEINSVGRWMAGPRWCSFSRSFVGNCFKYSSPPPPASVLSKRYSSNPYVHTFMHQMSIVEAHLIHRPSLLHGQSQACIVISPLWFLWAWVECGLGILKCKILKF